MSLFDLPTEITEFDSADDPVVVVNHEGVVVLFNPHAEKLFEVDADDIIGEYLGKLQADMGISINQQALNQVIGGGTPAQ